MNKDKERHKRQVYIQLSFAKVGEVNTVKESFDAEVIIKSRWKEPTLEGKDASEEVDFQSLWNPKIFIENTIGDPQTRSAMMTETRGSEMFIVEKKKIKGSFVELMELTDYPFDIQDLSIMIKSDTSLKDTELMEDPQDIHRIHTGSFMDEQEFYLYRYVDCVVPPLNMDTSLGVVKQKRPCLKATIKVARLIQYFVWNVFVLLNLLMILSFASFAIEPISSLPNRLQLTFVLVLSAVTFKNILNAYVPKISYFTYIDKYTLVMIILLVVISAWHGLLTRVKTAGREGVDLAGLVAFAVFYILFNLFFFLWIYYYSYAKHRNMARLESAYEKRLSVAMSEGRQSAP